MVVPMRISLLILERKTELLPSLIHGLTNLMLKIIEEEQLSIKEDSKILTCNLNKQPQLLFQMQMDHFSRQLILINTRKQLKSCISNCYKTTKKLEK